ncbi:hypothetical protein EDB85DRAFT_2133456 [Lactarius pseudohatsudake]|nr:hypothetical protein EDB85DRAFT_2133456 [Lactarius pseudohatsudake]
MANNAPASLPRLLLGPLNHLNSVAQQLLQPLSPPHTKPPHPPSITALADADAALSSVSDVLAPENSRRNVIVQLEEGRRDLEAIIAEGDQAKPGAIPYPELLAYAQSLSAFTSAPPNLPDLSLPGQPPPPLFFPPFPNEEKMRRGHLNAEEPLGPLGETHSVGRPPSQSPEPHRGQAANPYRPMDNRPPQQMFELDLDLNPDL